MAKRCKESFAVWVKGVPRVVAAGEVVANDDPVVARRPMSFEDVDAAFTRNTPQVEQATAAPGEKRSVGRPRKTAAPKSGD